ncbi:ArnT family glycosyltransferase [Streptomyces ovatisporus]|uniref:ArnT family glycosyltransferase n=1 Tax=Streptomyces ovatisporus TaxID=1128682 RepID=A0ABV9A4J1_9ACTN
MNPTGTGTGSTGATFRSDFHSTETARELRRAGVHVTYLTARPRGAARRETTVHGTVVRGGGRLTVWLFVLLWLVRNRHTVDAVVGVWNGLPLFSPLVLPRRTPVALLVPAAPRRRATAGRGRARLLRGVGVLCPIAGLLRRVEARAIRLVYGRRALCVVVPPSSRDAPVPRDAASSRDAPGSPPPVPSSAVSPASSSVALRASLGRRGRLYPAQPGPANTAHLLAALTAEHQRLHAPGPPSRMPGDARTPVTLPRTPRTAVGLAALCVFALVMRMTAVDSAYDLHVDECYYVEIGRSIARGEGPAYHGGYFALHPPAFFALLAAVLQVTGSHGDLMTDVLALRPVSAVLGSVGMLAATMLLRRAVRPAVAWAVGLLLALDPFLNRFDSRAMLEAQAMAATVVGLLILARTPNGRRARTATAVGAGLAFAVAVTTKDWYSLITFLPVAALGLLSTGAVRRMRLTAAAVTVAGYGSYVAATAATGGWPAWREQKLDGLLRALGVRQITGFGSPHNTTDLRGRLLAHLDLYLVPYGLIALGACATGWLLWCRRRHPGLFAGSPARSLITAAAACSYPANAYAGVWGTTEEQMFYPTVVLSALAVGLAVHLLRCRQVRTLRGTSHGRVPSRGGSGDRDGGRSRTERRSRGRRGRIVAALPLLLTALALTLDARAWTRVHTTPDDAHRRTRVWVDGHIPRDATIAATDDTVPQAIPRAHQRDFTGPEDLVRLRPGYLVVSRELVAQGYTTITPGLYAELDRYARLVHREPGATAKALEIYEVRRSADAQARGKRR